jgi:hypothetical protein
MTLWNGVSIDFPMLLDHLGVPWWSPAIFPVLWLAVIVTGRRKPWIRVVWLPGAVLLLPFPLFCVLAVGSLFAPVPSGPAAPGMEALLLVPLYLSPFWVSLGIALWFRPQSATLSRRFIIGSTFAMLVILVVVVEVSTRRAEQFFRISVFDFTGRPVRDFFEHVRATPENGFPPPYETNGTVPTMNREVVHSQLVTPFGEQNVDLVWVHGWRLTKYERQNWAEMMFKRLWHAGYKGRLHAFTWPTLSGDDPLFESGPDGKLSYDRSEFRAWKSGAALEGYLHTLRNSHSASRLVVVSHSMGNVVTGEALRRNAPADLQIMMQAALPASCYDIRAILNQPELLDKEGKKPTPDFDVDLGYR